MCLWTSSIRGFDFFFGFSQLIISGSPSLASAAWNLFQPLERGEIELGHRGDLNSLFCRSSRSAKSLSAPNPPPIKPTLGTVF